MKPPVPSSGRGGSLFKARFRPRTATSLVEERIFLCPICHAEIRQSAETCPHCGARRRFGPTRLETSAAMLIGGSAGLLYSFGILHSDFWIGPCAAFGALVGFYVAQIRFDGDRWQT